MVRSISVWCEAVGQSFGDIVVPSDLDLATIPSTIEGPALQCHNELVLGDLSTLQHDVEGTVVALSNKVIEIRNFRYDGTAPATFFWADTTSSPSANGIIMPSPSHGCKDDEDLAFADGTVTIRAEMPAGMTLDDIAGGSISVWCEQFAVNFGHVLVPSNLRDVPRDGPDVQCSAAQSMDLGPLRSRAHDVQGTVVALSDRLLEFRNFQFDGSAPAAFFYASSSNPPQRGGLILLSTVHGCRDDRDLPGADGSQTWRAEFPPGTSLRDFAGGSISVWCDAVDQNFGEVAVPSDLSTLPQAQDGPALECFAVPEIPEIALVPNGYNCEALNDDYQVRWQVQGDSIAFELVGRIEEDEYMGFGRSGSDERTLMVGADPIIADYFNGEARARDFFMTAQAQCANAQGVCPDTDVDSGVDDAMNVSGERNFGLTLVRFKKPLLPSNVDLDVAGNSADRLISAETGVSTFIVWALGPVDASTGLPFFHSNDYARTNVSMEFGRPVVDNCEPLLGPIDPNAEVTFAPTAAPIEPFQLPILRDTTEFVARIGPSAGERGYEGVTGRDAWGIAWYMNDALIPIIEMRRGTTYRFLVNGGNDETSSAQHHPLYLTDSLSGGYAQRTPAERASENVFAGIEIQEETADGVVAFSATAQGTICEYTASPSSEAALDLSFPDYFETLNTECANDENVASSAGMLEFTPDETTPDLLYYQCVTHRNLGWKIRVIDSDAPSILQVSCDNLRSNPVQLTDEITLNAVLDPFGETITVEMIYEGEAWLAMGFTNGQSVMLGSQAVIGLPSAGTVQKYELNSRGTSGVVPMPEEKQTLINATIVQEGGQTILSFTKLLREEGEHPIRNEGPNTFLYAYGTENTLGFHGGRGGFELEPAQCTQILDGQDITPDRASSVADASTSLNKEIWIAHGVCASIAWAILVPLAVGASLLRDLLESMGLPEGAWFQIHRVLNTVAVLLTVVAFALAVHALNDSGVMEHFSLLSHHTVGLVIFIASIVQALNGILRPSLPHAPVASDKEAKGNMDAVEDGMPSKRDEQDMDLEKSAARTVWEYGHRFLGVGLLACAWWQVQSGLELYALRFNEEDLRGVFWGVALGITGTIRVLLGYHKSVSGWKNK